MVVLEKTLESPLDCKEIQPVHPKRDQSWVFIGRTDFETEIRILWPPDVKSWLIGKDPDAGKDWGQEEKGTTEDKMPGLNHWLDAHEFGWTLGVVDGQGSLACCNSWGPKSRTWLSDWTELNMLSNFFMRDLTECGPLEKGMANHFSILALRTPWTVWKGKMIGYWKRNSPGQ